MPISTENSAHDTEQFQTFHEDVLAAAAIPLP